ncbi:MAG: complex I NDUFA9 subunit family protein [Limnohabitans sp.]|nr:MAG: complex I NDUFA9 subunit family protein [Limnohabitans sp.]
MNNSPVLVLGGSGFVGRHVCEQLVRAGYRVTVPTRRASRAACVQTLPGLTVIKADVHDDAALAGLMAGHAAVVNLIAVLHGNEDRFERMHVQLPQRIARAMRQAGVARLVHVSALGADPQGPSMYQRSKAHGEAVLQAAGLELTILRPSVIFGAKDKFLNLFADLQQVLPFMPLAGSSTKFQPVWVNDVAAAIVRSLQDRSVIGQTLEATGPETFTLGELVKRSGQWAGVNSGKGRPVIPLPRWVGWLQALGMEMLPGEPLMSRDNLASMKVDNVASGQLPGLQALGITPAAVSAVAPTYLGHKGPRSRLDGWRSRH